jgi:hypothetical protein
MQNTVWGMGGLMREEPGMEAIQSTAGRDGGNNNKGGQPHVIR